MFIRITGILLISIMFSVTSFSQENPASKDSLKEIIIFEYDTVYLNPDTVKLTDTIVELIRIKNKKWKLTFPDISSNIIFNHNSFLSPLTPNSISILAAPFINGNSKIKNIADSLTNQTTVNKFFSAQWNYIHRKILFSIGFGYTPYHEKYAYNRSYYSSNSGNNTIETYDSLQIAERITYNFYYNYLNLFASIGKIWKLSPELLFSMNIGFVGDYLIGYKQGYTNISASTIRKFDISIILNTNFSYKLSQNYEIFLTPFYHHSIINDKKYPSSSFQKIGIAAGFSINLK